MGCVVLHPATANAATTASSSGRFMNSIEFLIVNPLTDIFTKSALIAFLATKSRVRGTILTDKLRYISGRLGAPASIGRSFCAVEESPWRNHVLLPRAEACLYAIAPEAKAFRDD